jgi:hypothetical protein
VTAHHDRAWVILHVNGWRLPANLPPLTAARRVREVVGDAAAPLERLVALHYAVRYGGADDDQNAEEAEACAQEVWRIPGPQGPDARA